MDRAKLGFPIVSTGFAMDFHGGLSLGETLILAK
jgi:hypothetical protein